MSRVPTTSQPPQTPGAPPATVTAWRAQRAARQQRVASQSPEENARILQAWFTDVSNSAVAAAHLKAIHQDLLLKWSTQNAEVRAIREAICAHPNTPSEVVAELLVEYPEAFCRNPAAPLLALEAPELLVPALRQGRLPALLRYENLPASVVALALAALPKDPALAEAARQHVALAGEVAPADVETEVRASLRRLVMKGSVDLRCRAYEAVEAGLLPDWLCEGLSDPLENIVPFPPTVRPGDAALARERARFELPDVLTASTASGVRTELRRAIESIATGQASVPKRGYGGALVKVWDRDTPAADLEALAAENEGRFRLIFARGLARHPHASKALLLSLVSISDAAMRRLLLRRPDVPPAVATACQEVAAHLRRDGLLPAIYRCFACSSPELTLEELRTAAASADWLERLGAARNPTLPRLSRRRLSALRHDGNRLVRAATRATLAAQRSANLSTE